MIVDRVDDHADDALLRVLGPRALVGARPLPWTAQVALVVQARRVRARSLGAFGVRLEGELLRLLVATAELASQERCPRELGDAR